MSKLLAVTSVVVALCKVSSAASYTFDDVPQATTTPFFVADEGVVATFSSPQGDLFFVAAADVFVSLSGNFLVDSDVDQNELDIDFSQPIQSLTLLFVLNTLLESDTLQLEASLGGNNAGFGSATGNVPAGLSFPEGTISFSGAVFDHVRLSSSARDFGIDDIGVSVASPLGPIPEPSFWGLTGVALLTMAIISMRRPRATVIPERSGYAAR